MRERAINKGAYIEVRSRVFVLDGVLFADDLCRATDLNLLLLDFSHGQSYEWC